MFYVISTIFIFPFGSKCCTTQTDNTGKVYDAKSIRVVTDHQIGVPENRHSGYLCTTVGDRLLRDINHFRFPRYSAENGYAPFRFFEILSEDFNDFLVRFSIYRRRGNADNKVIRVDLFDFIFAGVGFYLYTDLHNF